MSSVAHFKALTIYWLFKTEESFTSLVFSCSTPTKDAQNENKLQWAQHGLRITVAYSMKGSLRGFKPALYMSTTCGLRLGVGRAGSAELVSGGWPGGTAVLRV